VNAYLPCDLEVLPFLGVALAGTLLLGLAISRLGPAALARPLAWFLVITATAGVERLCAEEPPGFRMVALIGAMWLGMKAVVSAESRAAGETPLSAWRWLGFASLWAGMRPGLFAAAGEPPLAGAGALMVRGIRWLALGLGFIILARLAWLSSAGKVLTLLLLLPGLSLVLHFGVFNIVAGAWRLAGVDCRPLFRAPLACRSLGEFWGGRWNLAFTEMIALAVYRPLIRLGRPTATMIGFLFSGLAHEVVISVPVRAGYGLPTLYFLLHGALVLLERRFRPTETWGRLAHVWTLGWLALPLPILFHPWFLEEVVLPIIGV
jgi:alginate O-acetyltransferase complex protein AlgI